MADKDPVRGTYQHYKGGFYEVLGVAEEPETGQRFVVYESLGIAENLEDEDEAGPKLGRGVVKNGSKGALAVCSPQRFSERVESARDAPRRVPRFKLIAPLPRD